MTQEPFRIDVHHHIVPQEYVAAVTVLGIKGGGGVDFPHWDPQRSLNMMDRQGIATSILSLPFEESKTTTDLMTRCAGASSESMRLSSSRVSKKKSRSSRGDW
jgi:hypothetical protein